MSTKRLIKSVVESGQRRGKKKDRKHFHHMERQAVRQFISNISKNDDAADDEVIEPAEKQGNWHYPNTKVVYRWLNSQIGRPWDNVRADLVAEFSGSAELRDAINRYVISDIESPNVAYLKSLPEDPNTSFSKYDFYIDESGLLQKKRYIGRHYRTPIPPFDTKQLTNWLNGRIVGKVGNKFFWFIPADKNKKRGGYSHVWRLKWGYPYQYYYTSYSLGATFNFERLRYEVIYKMDSLGQFVIEDGKKVELERIPKWVSGTPNGLRQNRQLNSKEMEYWNTIPEYYQTKSLELSPTYPEELKPKPRRYY